MHNHKMFVINLNRHVLDNKTTHSLSHSTDKMSTISEKLLFHMFFFGDGTSAVLECVVDSIKYSFECTWNENFIYEIGIVASW